MVKTNVHRLLDEAGIAYTPREYDVADGKIDALSIAAKIGIPPEQCYKTLVTGTPGKEYFVFVIPAIGELDLKKAARAAGVKSIVMIPLKQLFPLTGYIHGGCSPIGQKRSFPTFIEETAQLYDYIGISAGRVGSNVALNAEALADYLGATFADLLK